jgi:hypothetical protein
MRKEHIDNGTLNLDLQLWFDIENDESSPGLKQRSRARRAAINKTKWDQARKTLAKHGRRRIRDLKPAKDIRTTSHCLWRHLPYPPVIILVP